MVMQAIMDRVFIRLEKPKAPAGLIINEDLQNPQNIGRVESVGEEVTSVKVGDRVIFHVFDELDTPDPEIVVVREYSLLGVLTDE